MTRKTLDKIIMIAIKYILHDSAKVKLYRFPLTTWERYTLSPRDYSIKVMIEYPRTENGEKILNWICNNIRNATTWNVEDVK